MNCFGENNEKICMGQIRYIIAQGLDPHWDQCQDFYRHWALIEGVQRIACCIQCAYKRKVADSEIHLEF